MDPQRVPVIGAGPPAISGDGAGPSRPEPTPSRSASGVPPTGSRPPLRRATDDAVIGGVAAGLARTLGVDVPLVRIAFVVLALGLDGLGVLAYLAAWALIPAAGSIPGAAPAPRRGAGIWIGGALVAVGGFLALEAVAEGRGWSTWRPWGWLSGELVLPLGLVAVGALLWWRAGSVGTTPASAPVVAPGPIGSETSGPGSRLTPLVLGFALLALGAMWSLDVLEATSLGAVRIAGGTLLVIASGLLVGAFAGRARGLVLPGAVLGLVVIGMLGAARGPDAVAPGASVLEQPANLEELSPRGYSWAAGDVVLDLRSIDADTIVAGGGTAIVEAELGVGSLEVRVPEGLTVEVAANVGIGTLEVPTEVGLDGEVGIGRLITPGSDQRGLGLRRELLPPDRAAVLILRLDVGVGRVVITR